MTAASLRQPSILPGFGLTLGFSVFFLCALVLIPLGVYLASYWAWFASETGVDRHAVGTKIGTDGPFSFVPDSLRSLWYYSANVLEFHSGLTNSAGNHHPWESKPWTWPMGLRPMLYYYDNAVTGCGAASCLGAIMLIGTPAMWWLAFPVIGWAVWRSVGRMDWRYAGVLVAYAAGLLPWFLNLDRGIPYYQEILGQNFEDSEVRIRNAFRDELLTVPDVIEILLLQLEYESPVRTLTVRAGSWPTGFGSSKLMNSAS